MPERKLEEEPRRSQEREVPPKKTDLDAPDVDPRITTRPERTDIEEADLPGDPNTPGRD